MSFLRRAWVLLTLLASGAAAAQTAVVIPVDDAIGPATADFVVRSLAKATGEGADVVVLQLDTPGGLDTSMRVIIKEILSSPVPVVVFVGPQGARAASAGTYILYAAHVAAMAPATNLGAATPVMMEGPLPGDGGTGRGKPPASDEKKGADPEKDAAAEPQDGAEPAPLAGDAMTRKQVNDAAAYLRGLAQMRGRNAEWAEQAVREAVSLSAEEALEKRVIDVIATDVDDLLRKIDGRKIATASGERELATEGIAVRHLEPDWRARALAVVTNPSMAYILLLVGIYGILFEFYNPGFLLPGVAGAICLLVGLFSLHLLPLNYAGLALILLGIVFMMAEVFVPSFGALGVGGLIALVLGSVMLIDTDIPGFGVPVSVIASVTATTAVFVFSIVGMALKARSRPVVSGAESLVGATAEVLEDCAGEGWARVHGEIWRIRSGRPLVRGQRVRVIGLTGLVLEVSAE